MTRKSTPHGPILDAAPGLRQRQRANGSWRVWWEPTAAQRQAGAVVVELSADKIGHASREAMRLHTKWSKAVKGEVEANPAQVSGRSINALIADYRASRAFLTKAVNTQRAYRADLRAIAAKWGPQPVTLFDKPMIVRWYEALYAEMGPHRSRAIIRMFSILFSHAETRGWRAENSHPCLRLRLETPDGRSRVGTWDEFDALVRASRRLKRRMVTVGLHLAMLCGQRQMDILLAKPEDFYQITTPNSPRPLWVWQLVQNKTGKALEVPVMHAAAVAALRAQLHYAARAGSHTLLWDEVTGKPFNFERFFREWDQVRIEAAKEQPTVETLTWRDLRRTFSNMSRAGGISDADTADVLGNTAAKNTKLRRTYMAPQLVTAMRAVAAVQRPQPIPPKPERKQA